MDGVSVAASIVGIATAGIQVSIKIVTLADQISTAADRISSIGNDVSLTSAILYQLGDLMSQKTSSGSLPVFSKDGLESTKSSAENCQKLFVEIERQTAKASNVIRGRKRPIGEKVKLTRVERAKWPFLQPSIEVLRTDLREAKGTLMLMLQLASLALSKRVADLNVSASSGITEQRDMIRSILILKRQQQQDDLPSSDSDSDFSDPRQKKPSRTKRYREDTTTQSPTSASLTQPSESFAPTARSSAAKPAAVENQMPERSGVPAAETEAEVPKDIDDTRTADASSQTASEFVVLSRTNINSQTRQRSGLENQSSQRREIATCPVSQDKAKEVKLLLFTITPSITVQLSMVKIEWNWQDVRFPENELRELVTLNKTNGVKSVFASLEALHVWERALIGYYTNRLGGHVTLVSFKRTEHDLREGNISLNGVPSFQLITEQPACDAREVKLARPTYVKVARWHLYPETLDEYNLPWTWDDRDPNYIIIKQWIPECDQLILFEHTQALKIERELQRETKHSTTELRREKNNLMLVRKKNSPSKNWLFDSEGDQSSEDESTTGYHAKGKGEEDEATQTEAEDESEENAVVNELLEKYTAGLNDM